MTLDPSGSRDAGDPVLRRSAGGQALDFVVLGFGLGALAVVIGLALGSIGTRRFKVRDDPERSWDSVAVAVDRGRTCRAIGRVLASAGGLVCVATLLLLVVGAGAAAGLRTVSVVLAVVTLRAAWWAVQFRRQRPAHAQQRRLDTFDRRLERAQDATPERDDRDVARDRVVAPSGPGSDGATPSLGREFPAARPGRAATVDADRSPAQAGVAATAMATSATLGLTPPAPARPVAGAVSRGVEPRQDVPETGTASPAAPTAPTVVGTAARAPGGTVSGWPARPATAPVGGRPFRGEIRDRGAVPPAASTTAADGEGRVAPSSPVHGSPPAVTADRPRRGLLPDLAPSNPAIVTDDPIGPITPSRRRPIAAPNGSGGVETSERSPEAESATVVPPGDAGPAWGARPAGGWGRGGDSRVGERPVSNRGAGTSPTPPTLPTPQDRRTPTAASPAVGRPPAASADGVRRPMGRDLLGRSADRPGVALGPLEPRPPLPTPARVTTERDGEARPPARPAGPPPGS